MSDFNEKLKAFLHDPIDKCFDIPTHIQRAKKYAEIIGVSSIENTKGPDEIASCMERSFLPKPEKFDKKKEDLYQEFNEIRHPLSEEKKNPEKWDKSEIFKKAETIFEKLAYILPQNDKEKFFYLWRNLVDKMFEEFKDLSIAKFIPILPADTRIPDHSIWEHLKIASAINAFEYLQNNSLFLFSIGPVQSFISQARKTQDLFMGSFILSFLTFKSIEVVVEKYGPTNIIYPDLYGQPLMDYYLRSKKIEVINSSDNFIDQPTIPNRFVAILPITEKQKIKDFASEIENKVKGFWSEIVNNILEAFELKDKVDKNLIEKQTKNFPEIYWTAIPLKIDSRDVEIDDFENFFEEDEIKRWKKLNEYIYKYGEFPPNIGFFYQLAYSSLEKSMGARKNLRDFEQKEEYGKKCHLCGERQGIIKAGMGNLGVGKYISSKENLCIICFTKRALDKYLEKEFGVKF